MIQEREYSASFEHLPWFREARVAEILGIAMPGPNHPYWTVLDVDLAIESLEEPEAFSLVRRDPGRSTTRRPSRATRG